MRWWVWVILAEAAFVLGIAVGALSYWLAETSGPMAPTGTHGDCGARGLAGSQLRRRTGTGHQGDRRAGAAETLRLTDCPPGACIRCRQPGAQAPDQPDFVHRVHRSRSKRRVSQASSSDCRHRVQHTRWPGREPGSSSRTQPDPPHSSLGKNTTPAMAAGVADHVWTCEEIAALD